MPYNGSGGFSLAEAAFVPNTTILAASMNNDLSDIASNGLSFAITKDGQTTITANLPMSGFRHTGVGNSSSRTMYATTGQVQDQAYSYCGTSGGSANAQTLTPSPAISSYTAGGKFGFLAGFTNTASCTLQVSGLSSPRTIQINGNPLLGGEILSGRYYEVEIGASAVELLPTGNAITQGYHIIPLNAEAWRSRTSNGPTSSITESSSNKVMNFSWDFDKDADEFVQVRIPVPPSYSGGAIKFDGIWGANSGSGDVVFGLQAQFIRNDDPIDGAFGSAVTVTDTLTATTDYCMTPVSAVITPAGTFTSNCMLILQLYRDADAGGDTLNADARLFSVRIYFPINQANDSF